MSSVNKVLVLGRVGKDLELGETTNGNVYTNFSVAASEKFKNKAGEWVDKTEWVNVVVWGKLAEVCVNHLVKGSQVFVEGKLQTDSYEKDGVTRYVTKVVANNVTFVGAKVTKEATAVDKQTVANTVNQNLTEGVGVELPL